MNCTGFDDIAELYVGGELGPAETAEAERHVAECAGCRQRAETARAHLRALGAALAPHRAAEGFAERTMARIRAEAAPEDADEKRPEPLRSRILRYAALAAAACLLAMAGYGLLRRPGSGAWLESGTVAVLGPNARRLEPRSPLKAGDVLATPAHSRASLVLAGGRLRVVIAPLSVVRVTDPASGTALQLQRGEMYCHAPSGAQGAPMVASPLANVAAGPGVVSLHVAPEPGAPGASPETGPFQGAVTLASHDGAARVVVPGQQTGAVALNRGQVLVLSTDRRRSLAAPISFERLRELIEAELRGVRARHGELELMWDGVMAGPPGKGDILLFRGGKVGCPLFRAEAGGLSRRASEVQEALGQTRALHAELGRRLMLLERVRAEGPQAFRLIIQPARR